MHGHCFISLGQQDHTFLGSALHFSQNILTHLRLCQYSQDVKVGSVCKMQFRPSDIVVSPDILRLF